MRSTYMVYASKSGAYWRDGIRARYAKFQRALYKCRQSPVDGYTCWHIVREADGVVIAQSKNARV